MLNDEICKLRDELNLKIEQGCEYSVIYELSLKLDKLIAKYYESIPIRKNSSLDFLKEKAKL